MLGAMMKGRRKDWHYCFSSNIGTQQERHEKKVVNIL